MEQSRLAVAETTYRERGAAVALRAAAMNAKAMRIPLRTSEEAAQSPAVLVRVNHGRWLADCPWCSGAQVASLTDRRFLCADCFNGPVQGRLLATVWPGDDERAAIEDELLLRPESNRNWAPGETVADLVAEREAAEQGASSLIQSSQGGLLARIEALERLLSSR